MFEFICPDCVKEVTPSPVNYNQCPHCKRVYSGTEIAVLIPKSSTVVRSNRPRYPRGYTTEFYQAQELANRMRDNGASDAEVEQMTGIPNPFRRA